MRKCLLTLFALILFGSGYFPPISTAHAQAPITDWYVKDFQSDITLNPDNSLIVTEKITADCDSLPNKHGIFRTLPLEYQKNSNEKVKTPVELISITDFNNNPLEYSTSKQSTNSLKTLTWKIGDPNKTVTGINYYKITYNVKHPVRSDNTSFDELYWNLSGNFWDIDINHFKATLHLPPGINQDNVKLSLYTGAYGGKSSSQATKNWSDRQTLNIETNSELIPGDGVTASLSFPKGIVAPYVYKPSFLEKYGFFFLYLIPLIVFLLCYRLWNRYGRDPKINSAIVPEFEIPENLTPLSMGLIETNGNIKNHFLSAEIIYLATKEIITIEQIKEKSLLQEADYLLTLKRDYINDLPIEDQVLLVKVFNSIGKKEQLALSKLKGTLLSTAPEKKAANEKSIRISTMKNSFYAEIKDIEETTFQSLVSAGFLVDKSNKLKTTFITTGITIGVALPFLLFYFVLNMVDNSSAILAMFTSSIISALVLIGFGLIMPKRTKEGAMLEHRIKGFRMYMETAEKYRQQFNEKENIFEKFLPYAIMFGMTKKWINAMKSIYGESYINSYHPVWFYGMNGNAFDFNAFADNIESVSSQMATTMASNPSSSGVGGGGFSGGGGGGGGGGGW